VSLRIPWWEPQVGGEERELLEQVLASNFLNNGEFTTRFENQLAQRLGCRHVVAVTSGTAALFLALAAGGVGPNDEVIVPDLTFIATANAVRLAGATPVLVDIDPRTLNLDPESMQRAITTRTRAVIPVHLSGRGAPMAEIQQLARAHDLFVIEDAAEALGSQQNGQYLGTIGHAGCLSFSPNKTITTGQGGAVLTNDDQLNQRLRELKDQGRPVRGTGGDDLHPSLGFNFKLTNLQAAIGIAQLGRLDERIARLRRTYHLYAEQLNGVAGITLPGFGEGEVPQWVDALSPRRDELVRYLSANGIDCRRFWFPLHTQPPYRQADEGFPHAMSASAQGVWLPSAFTLSDADVMTVGACVRACLQR